MRGRSSLPQLDRSIRFGRIWPGILSRTIQQFILKNGCLKSIVKPHPIHKRTSPFIAFLASKYPTHNGIARFVNVRNRNLLVRTIPDCSISRIMPLITVVFKPDTGTNWAGVSKVFHGFHTVGEKRGSQEPKSPHRQFQPLFNRRLNSQPVNHGFNLAFFLNSLKIQLYTMPIPLARELAHPEQLAEFIGAVT